MCPSPLLRDVGTNNIALTHLISEDEAAVAPPLSKGMWAANSRSTEEWGMDKHEGGPKEWEAYPVRPHNEPRGKSWFVFSHTSLLDAH